MSGFAAWMNTLLKGKLVGEDNYGNKYYRCAEKRTLSASGRTERRWVRYDKGAEASKVPPEWHAWLHHTSNDVPAADAGPIYDWQTPHRPNQTGTAGAYRPAGHAASGAARASTTGDYAAWTPE